MTKENGRERKQLMNLITGYAGALCSIFLQLFHKLEIISKIVLKPSCFKILLSFVYYTLGWGVGGR